MNAWPRFLTVTSLMSIICGMKRRRERCSQDRGTERELWAREQVRKETRKGKSFKPLPNEETRTVRENGSGSNRERLTSLSVSCLLCCSFILRTTR